MSAVIPGGNVRVNVTSYVSAPEPTPSVDPVTGLCLYELSHPWGHGSPTYPGFDDVQISRSVTHARHGVMSQRIRTVMHTGTHVNAPKHLVQRGVGVGDLDLSRFFGTGVVLDIPKGEWGLVTPEDLEAADPSVKRGDIVVVLTGWHAYYSDSQRYFAHAPGLSAEAANWLISREVRLVGIDGPSIDHPLATTLADHRSGGHAPYLVARYESVTGRKALEDFPELNPAHRALLTAGIPTIENVGGAVNDLGGRRATIQSFPWRWKAGDACPVRVVALLDGRGDYRIEKGDHW